jgi:hypothetical protein
MEASTSEDIRAAASVALGNVAIGNLEKFLPEILGEIKKNPKKKYLLLGSLREVIVRQSGTKEGISQLLKFFDQFSGILFGINLTSLTQTRSHFISLSSHSQSLLSTVVIYYRCTTLSSFFQQLTYTTRSTREYAK